MTQASEKTVIENVMNHVQMTPNIATSGQPDVDEFKAISDAGYTTVVNLSPHTAQDAMPDEGQVVARNFMSYINIPVLNEDPLVGQLQMFCAVMETMKDQKVWVHCGQNNKVAAFMYLYLRYRQGYSHEEALSPRFSEWVMDQTWVEFMEEGAFELQVGAPEFTDAESFAA